MRKTKSVKELLALIEQSEHPLSVVSIVETLKDQMNKTTVYRILERLEQDGIVHAVTGAKGLLWYAMCKDCTADHHYDLHPHFQCKECGKMECIELDIPFPRLPNHQVHSVDVLLTGKCEACLD